MPTPFQDRIHEALADSNLQIALDGNAERRLKALKQSFASLPEDQDSMRLRAHAVRKTTIENLETYLAKFSKQAEANGFIVHHAKDGAQAVAIILNIARRMQAHLVAKSKSMVSEEIQLNKALEAAGLRVVETDLGEYIVQLRGEAPAHIITPAVHLNRAQVGRTFEEKLGIPFTEDIPTLTTAARQVLRQTFLEADIGISGVNFGIAETGTLCTVTNEGNGRMCMTLPKVHIALMGIERLVPTFEDLRLMLYLLPRSATGQKITVYTSLVNSPRRPGEIDGCLERHIILLDNGRLAMRSSPLTESLYCIRCGACLNACPVFREIGGHAYVGTSGSHTPYPGPIGSVISPGLFGSEFGNLARASSLCGACQEACPVNIDLPLLLLRARAMPAMSKSKEPPSQQNPAKSLVPLGLRYGLKIFTWLAVSPARYRAAQRMASLLSRLIPVSTGWIHLPAFTGWGFSRDIPKPAIKPFSQLFASINESTLTPCKSLEPPTKQTIKSSSGKTPTETKQQSQRISQFEEEIISLGGIIVRCRPDEVAAQIIEVIKKHQVKTIQAWAEDYLPAGLHAALRLAGIKICLEPDPNIKIGLTGAYAGIAESGTLVLPAGIGKPLTASLLPEIHLAVVHAEDIHENLTQVFQQDAIRQSSSTILISGPSRTADIEMTLTIGVHGPGELHVFVI